jgi:hypothetical protein
MFKGGFKKVLDFGNGIRRGVSKGYNFVKKIPVVGNLVDKLLDTPLPYIGASARQIGHGLDTALDVGNEVGRVVNPLPQTPDTIAKRRPLPTPPTRHF